MNLFSLLPALSWKRHHWLSITGCGDITGLIWKSCKTFHWGLQNRICARCEHWTCEVMEDISFQISGRQRDLLSQKIFPSLFQTHLEVQIPHAALSQVKFTPAPLIISSDPSPSMLMCCYCSQPPCSCVCCKTYNQPAADLTDTEEFIW